MNHTYFDIPGWFSFHDVYDRAVAFLGKDGAHFVEVGCYEGRSAAYMGVNIVNSHKKIRFDCVDSWEKEIKQYDVDGRLTIAAGSPQIKGRDVFDRFQKNMSVFDGLADIRTFKGQSTVIAANYADNSLDFVFLDASHAAQDVYDDIKAWRPKLKPLGVMAGDDISYPGVGMALQKNGMGTELNPLVQSDGGYKSWIHVPIHLQKMWITRNPEATDFANQEGKAAAAADTVREHLGIGAHA